MTARLSALVLAAAVSTSGLCADLHGRVVGLADGDTLTVLDAEHMQHKIRLAGIDAPERGQAFGTRARATLAACAFGRQVDVHVSKRDRYGRSVGTVIAHGIDCNLRQIELGMAWHYKAYQREQPARERQAYAEAEELAKTQRGGLWSDPLAQAPWEYRAAKRSALNQPPTSPTALPDR